VSNFTNVDYVLTMNENYSVVNPHTIYANMQNFSKKGFPMSKILNGVKVGGCWPGTNGDGTNVDQIKTLLTTKVDGNKTLTEIGAGWCIWNLSRDAGCFGGRGKTPSINEASTPSKTCFKCNQKTCPIGLGSFSAGPQWSFLKAFKDL